MQRILPHSFASLWRFHVHRTMCVSMTHKSACSVSLSRILFTEDFDRSASSPARQGPRGGTSSHHEVIFNVASTARFDRFLAGILGCFAKCEMHLHLYPVRHETCSESNQQSILNIWGAWRKSQSTPENTSQFNLTEVTYIRYGAAIPLLQELAQDLTSVGGFCFLVLKHVICFCNANFSTAGQYEPSPIFVLWNDDPVNLSSLRGLYIVWLHLSVTLSELKLTDGFWA